MVRFFIFLSLGLSFCLGACGTATGLNLGRYPDIEATPQKFIHCHGYGCTQKTLVGFNDHEWNSLRHIFKEKSEDAKSERQKIAKAISLMEIYVGALDGTKDDLPKAPLVRTSDTELDCIDETINTTKYLNFLQEGGLLKFHTVDRPVYKGMFLNGIYPHNSASIKEIETGQIYVVDSYIFKNGVEPNIRKLESWLKYRLEDLPVKKTKI